MAKRKSYKTAKYLSSLTSVAPKATEPGNGDNDNGMKRQENLHTVKPHDPVKSRPPVILVKAGREEFPALIRKVRGGVNKEV